MKNFSVHKNFYFDYRKLRREFEENFKDSRTTHQKRFVWDFWFDENQYHAVRTPAFHYFSQKVYRDFHSYLVQWGRENLGCHDISPPWLSYYVDGCFQNLHSDVPHGPWAFVYSLTPNKKEFKGGETLILKESTLNYWQNYKQSSNYEVSNFVETIPSMMNQLIVFDPRFPHGVTEVKGNRDPMKSRLVLHGWFVNPRPYVVGGLTTLQVQKSVGKTFGEISQVLEQIELLDGALSIRLKVSPQGKVESYKVLTNTLLSLSNNSADVLYIQRELKRLFNNTKFRQAKKGSVITLPLMFK